MCFRIVYMVDLMYNIYVWCDPVFIHLLLEYSVKILQNEYTEILEVNLFAFAYRLFHEDFSPIYDF